MFGVLRTTLALMVMVYHLFAVGILPLGIYAVFGFYIISGYLMTLIMHESYGYTWIGRYTFTKNRFLRLYPLYWAAALFSIILILVLGGDIVIRYHPNFFLPHNIKGYISNITMLFPSWYPITARPRLVPPAWALTIEIFFYALICLGISKTFMRVKIWLFLSVCYVGGSFVAGLPWFDRYIPVVAASLPFAIGSSIYFISNNKNIYVRFLKLGFSSTLLFILLLVNCFVWILLSKAKIGSLVEIGFYLNILICALLVYSIVKGGQIIKIDKQVDKYIGDFSYPIYLLHQQSGLLISFLIFGEAFREYTFRGGISLIASLIFVVLLSTVLIVLIDKPIQNIRSKIKAGKALQRSFVPHIVEP
jgi:peptidoglycan/LPS O-acetylase OafA/YrhL